MTKVDKRQAQMVDFKCLYFEIVSEPVLSSTPVPIPLEEQATRTEQDIQTDLPQTAEPNPYDVIQSVSPYVTSLNTKTAKLKSGDDESTGSVNERSSYGSGVSSEDLLSRPSDNEDGPNHRKRKVKKSKSFLQKQGDKIKAKLSFRKKGDQKHKLRKKGRYKREKRCCFVLFISVR